MDITPIASSSSNLSYVDSPAYKNLEAPIRDMLTSTLSVDELNQLFPSSPTLPTPTVTLDQFFNIMITNAREFQQQLALNEKTDQLTREFASRVITILATSLESKFVSRFLAYANALITADTVVATLKFYIDALKSMVSDQNNQIASLNAGNQAEIDNITNLMNAYNTYVSTITASPINAVETPAGSGSYRISYPTTGTDAEKATAMQTKINAYNAASDTLNNKISAFNSFLTTRRQQIDSYNNEATRYNNFTSPNLNPLAAINTIFNTYNITGPDATSVSEVPDGILRPSDGNTTAAYPDITARAPTLVYNASNTTFYTVSSINPATVAPWTQTIKNGGINGITISNLSYNPVNPDAFSDDVFTFLYNRDVKPFDLAIDLTYLGVSAAQAQALFTPVTETSVDPLLNTKKIIRKVLPDTGNILTDYTDNSISSGSQESITETMGIKHIQSLLGRYIAKQAIEDLNLDLTADQKALLESKILLLSSVLISKSSTEALLPSLGPISDILSKLPSNSPVFSLLFAISFSNRAQEKIQGISVDALQNFIQNSKDLEGIHFTPAQLEALTTTLNIGLLLVATKLLTSVLGLPHLLPQLLNGVSPELQAQVKELVNQENGQIQETLQKQILDKFLGKGFNLEEAQFLASFGVSLIAKGVPLAPSATVVSRDTIQVDLLKDSLAAELILSGLDLKKAQNTADQIVEKALNKGPLSIEQFTNTIELNLRRLDIKENKGELASQLLVIPKDLSITSTNTSVNTSVDLGTNRLTETPEISPPNTNTTTSYTLSNPLNVNVQSRVSSSPVSSNVPPIVNPTGSGIPLSSSRYSSARIESTTNTENPPPTNTDTTTDIADNTGTTTPNPPPNSPIGNTSPRLSEAQIIALIEKRTSELLIPQIGAELARLVSTELAKTLFGTPNPDYADKADLKSPLSLINTIKDQIDHLNKENNKEYGEALAITFKETIKDSVQLNAFLEKLMDPANLLIYSFSSGIMYGGREPSNWKKSIDILI